MCPPSPSPIPSPVPERLEEWTLWLCPNCGEGGLGHIMHRKPCRGPSDEIKVVRTSAFEAAAYARDHASSDAYERGFRAGLASQRAVGERLKEALEFYADEKSWLDGKPGRWEKVGMAAAIDYYGDPNTEEFEEDHGEVARSALSEFHDQKGDSRG